MAWSREGMLPMLGLGAALALGGCSDMFTAPPPADAVAWTGTSTVGNPALPECGSFAFDLGQYQPATFMWDTISGRAHPTATPETRLGKVSETLTQWWVEGYVTDANFVQLETKMQRPVYFGARPYAVWRGSIADDRLVLIESGSPCNREVVLARG
jgi:hypothetical protein